jgi:aryl carrier-like protein
MGFFLIFLGETNSPKFVHRLRGNVGKNCGIWNVYGPAETTMLSTCYRIDFISLDTSVSIGTPLPNYQCKIFDVYLQPVVVNQEGELLVTGVGIFAGYFGRDDLTEEALIEIDGEIFYRTGDLVRMDHNGLLHYQGRKDHQIKLHGQRIELGEIERCLLNTSISACVVMKWGDDHLVAYVQTSQMNEEQLREHCRSHLPPHMIPSIFMILEKLPLNANGKIDRKHLPPPNFSHPSSRHLTNNVELLVPTNEIEVIVHHIWCDIFQQNQISIDTNIFTIGGHSLLIMQLFHRYKTRFHLQTNNLSIADLFQHPTITNHSKLISQTLGKTQNVDHLTWSSLNLVQCKKNNFLSLITSIYCLFRCRSSVICSRKNLFR